MILMHSAQSTLRIFTHRSARRASGGSGCQRPDLDLRSWAAVVVKPKPAAHRGISAICVPFDFQGPSETSVRFHENCLGLSRKLEAWLRFATCSCVVV